jgi:phage terminase large subunit-like protein
MTYSARAAKYARDVKAGRVVACRLVRLACVRHLENLKAQKTKAFPYRYDVEAAEKVCSFVELMPHVKGRWAARHERIRLEDWQCFMICVPFGWVQKSDGLRRYRRVYVEVPRKNAKSTVTAALGNYMFAADGEHGSEVYSGAGSEKQAWEVFGPARLMAKGTPDFVEAYGVDVNAKNLNILETASKFEPIIGKPGDGASPSFSITDEYHEHATDEQYDTMVTGMGAREQPMAWVITTAGSDTAGPCYALRAEVVDVLEGKVTNDQLFGVIYTVDDGDAWDDPAVVRKANPNFGVSVFGDYLLAQQRDAVTEPRKQSTFKTKHLNVWVTAAAPYFNAELWNRAGDESLKREDFAGEPCWMGLDLASKLDLSAALSVFERDLSGVTHYYVFANCYCPEERLSLPENRHYAGWAAEGHLIATPGNVTDYDYVERSLIEDAETFRIVSLGFDPWHGTQLATHLTDAGIECVEVPQTAKNLSDPMKWIQALIVDGRMHHDGNPVLGWAIGNVTAQVDRNDNVFPRKERPEAKIDPAVALIIAMSRARSEEERAVPQVLLMSDHATAPTDDGYPYDEGAPWT